MVAPRRSILYRSAKRYLSVTVSERFIKDDHVLAVADADGYNVMHFWSSRDREVNFLNEVDGFEGFTPLEIPWVLF